MTCSVMVSQKLGSTHTNTDKSHSLKLFLSQTVVISEEDSDEDEDDVITREALKRQSQLIIDSKSKKKPWKKKQGRF